MNKVLWLAHQELGLATTPIYRESRKVQSYLVLCQDESGGGVASGAGTLGAVFQYNPGSPGTKVQGWKGASLSPRSADRYSFVKSGDFLLPIISKKTHLRSPSTAFQLFQYCGKMYQSYGYMLSSFLYLLALYLCLFRSLSFSLFSVWTSLTAAPHQVPPPSWSSIKWSLDYFHFCTIKYCLLRLSDSFPKHNDFPTIWEFPKSKGCLAPLPFNLQ